MTRTSEFADPRTDCSSLVPQPIVRLNRATILGGVIVAYLLHAPFITTLLFAVVGLAAAFGRRASAIFWLGTIVLRPSVGRADGEDPRLMRFNNSLAAVALGAAQIAFLFHAPIAGWLFCGITALAAAVALGGFCVGCFLFFQFKVHRARLFGSTTR